MKKTFMERASSALESTIAGISPRWAFQRTRARVALGMVRRYEAASRGRRTDGWTTKSTSANAETRLGITISRNRARDLVRNNPYAARGIGFIAASIVGYGIKTTPQAPNKKKAPKLLAAWNDWAESTDCDVDGKLNMYGLQEQAARAVPESGEVLIRRKWRKADQGKIPIQIQVLESDFLDVSRDGVTSTGSTIIQGVQYDKDGRKEGYWLFDHHPGDGLFIATSRTFHMSNFVPASEIIHIFRADRPGQVRGITWLAPVVIRLRDFDEYEDAQLIRQKIAACFTAFVYDQDPQEATGSGTTAALMDRMEPALIQRLGPGQNVTLASPPGVQGYSEYSTVTLHGIAAGFQIPYEALTGDYSQVNFTSGRMGRSDFFGILDTWQWNMFIPSMCQGVFNWWLDAALLAGLPVQGVTAKFTPPRRTLVDPTREIPTIIKAIRGGVETGPEAIRSMGRDPEEFLDEQEAFLKELDRRGIILDSDPRNVTAQGMAQIAPPDDPPPNDGAGSKNTE